MIKDETTKRVSLFLCRYLLRKPSTLKEMIHDFKNDKINFKGVSMLKNKNKLSCLLYSLLDKEKMLLRIEGDKIKDKKEIAKRYYYGRWAINPDYLAKCIESKSNHPSFKGLENIGLKGLISILLNCISIEKYDNTFIRELYNVKLESLNFNHLICYFNQLIEKLIPIFRLLSDVEGYKEKIEELKSFKKENSDEIRKEVDQMIHNEKKLLPDRDFNIQNRRKKLIKSLNRDLGKLKDYEEKLDNSKKQLYELIEKYNFDINYLTKFDFSTEIKLDKKKELNLEYIMEKINALICSYEGFLVENIYRENGFERPSEHVRDLPGY